MSAYRILDTLYPSKSVDTGRPLFTYHSAHEWAMLRNIACGTPFRYTVKRDYTDHSEALLKSTGVI